MNKHVKALLITLGITILVVSVITIYSLLLYYYILGTFIGMIIIALLCALYLLYMNVLDNINNSHRH